MGSRFSRFLCLPALVVGLIILPGCSAVQKILPHRKRVPRAVAAPRPLAVGTISLVNEGSRFVLIDNGDLSAPEVGSTLKTFSSGVESSELEATGVRRRPFIIADIKAGTPRKGDRVMMMPVAQATLPVRKGGKGEAGVPIARAEAVEAPAPPKRAWWKIWPFGRK